MADLVRAQTGAGIEALVLAPHGPGLERRDTVGGSQVVRFRYGPARAEVLAYRGGLTSSVRRPLGAAVLAPFLASFGVRAAALARAERVDVIHAHWWLPAGLVGVGAARASGAPLVITCHGSDVELIRRPGLGRLARGVLGRAAGVGAVSGPLARAVGELTGVATRVLRMPLVTGAEPAGRPGPPPPLRLVCVGRLSPEKGFDIAIAAVDRLASRGLDLSLRIVGEGPERPSLERQARHLGARVVFEGPMSRAERDGAIRSSHALLAPSRHEGLGLVALESLALGTPVIASSVGGLVEVVGEPQDGILVPAGDPEALAAAIARLPLSPPTARAVEAHRPAVVAAEHLAAYQDALAGRAAGPR
ncbi:MAG: glycosyltransferase [Acidimicrobiales bacterium]